MDIVLANKRPLSAPLKQVESLRELAAREDTILRRSGEVASRVAASPSSCTCTPAATASRTLVPGSASASPVADPGAGALTHQLVPTALRAAHGG